MNIGFRALGSLFITKEPGHEAAKKSCWFVFIELTCRFLLVLSVDSRVSESWHLHMYSHLYPQHKGSHIYRVYFFPANTMHGRNATNYSWGRNCLRHAFDNTISARSGNLHAQVVFTSCIYKLYLYIPVVFTKVSKSCILQGWGMHVH